MLVTLPVDEAIRIARGALRRPEDTRGDYVARCTREARVRLQMQPGLASAEGGTGRLVLASSGRSSLAPEACPHCWKVPKRYAREGREWICGECGRVVRVSVALAGSDISHAA